MATSALNRYVYIDETGTHLGLTRLYGRAAPGQRVVEGTPDYSGPHFTLVAALSWNGIQAPLLFEGPMTGLIFETYVIDCLVPTLCRGDIVIMDNLSAHKRPAIQVAIEAQGARLEYLPPYSSDFNPIELGWAKVKSVLRAAKARVHAELVDAVCQGLQMITAADAQAWFAHCHNAVYA
jgi:transposase